MRMKIGLAVEGNRIPIEYRNMMLSIVKGAISNDERTFNRLYGEGNNVEKPYTYALNIPGMKISQDKKEISFIGDLSMVFSSNDSFLAMKVYNGLVKNRKVAYKGYSIVVTGIEILDAPFYHRANMAFFKTMSPVLIRKHDKESNKDYYLDLTNPNEEEEAMFLLIEHTKMRVQKKFGDKEKVEVYFVAAKKTVNKHYCGDVSRYLTGNVGYLCVVANADVAEYLYETGLGARRSEGFGCLESITDTECSAKLAMVCGKEMVG